MHGFDGFKSFFKVLTIKEWSHRDLSKMQEAITC